jgi:lysophospholipase L1-like esterase
MRRSRVATLVAVLAVALMGAGCSAAARDPAVGDPTAAGTSAAADGSGGAGGRSSAAARRNGADVAEYVAMGDSYSAGPFIPSTDLAGGCLRSDHNYPSLLARRLAVRTFVDVTCSGASTRDLSHFQRTYGDTRLPPQMKALTRRTDLVTLGIGGNDLNLFSTLIRTCIRLAAADPTGSPCARELATRGPDLAAATRTISDRVAAALRGVRARAPRATVLLVGYLRLVPEVGTCRALPLATGDYAEGRRISAVLDRALRRAAKRAGVRFADMYTASRGHDVCSERPWVNGRVTDRTRALAYHPLAAGMRADADRVLAALRSG